MYHQRFPNPAGTFRLAVSLLAILAAAAPARADLKIAPHPEKFEPNPASPCIVVKGTFMIFFTQDEQNIHQELQKNKAAKQEFIVTFFPEKQNDSLINALDGIITLVQLKPEKHDPKAPATIDFEVTDDGKPPKHGFTLKVLGPNKWSITGDEKTGTPFVTTVAASGYFQAPGPKVIQLEETIRPKGVKGVKDFKAKGQVTGTIEEHVVMFINESRMKDRVVSARDKDLPGGFKDLKVDTKKMKVDLKIEKLIGASGSAEFVKVDGAGKPVLKNDGKPDLIGNEIKGFTGDGTLRSTIIIFGEDVSDRPRNMAILATQGKNKEKKEVGCFTFTVFRVDVLAITEGKAKEVMPDSVTNFKGQKLSFVFQFNSRHLELGHQIFPDNCYGGIVIRGQIVPTGIPGGIGGDFNRMHSRAESFMWDRHISERQYNKDNCLFSPSGFNFAAKDNASDTPNDGGQDLTADPDSPKMPMDLFVWSLDAPNLPPKEVPMKGDIARVRNNFVERCFYAGRAVSQDLPWIWRASVENPMAGKKRFVQNNDYQKAGDNELKGDCLAVLAAGQAKRLPMTPRKASLR